MTSFKYLRTDEEIDSNTPLRKTLQRVFRQCSEMIVKAFLNGRGYSRIQLPYWILRYYIGLAFSPMHSNDLTVIKVKGSAQLPVIQYLARKAQSDFFVTQNIYLRRIYDFPYEKWVDNVKVVIDLGANIGLSSLYFSSHFPEAKLLCVEPTTENVEVLKRNLHGKCDVEIAAISSTDGTIEFGMSEWWGSGSAVKNIWFTRHSRDNRVEARSAQVRTVPSISLNTLLQKHEIEEVDVLKMDIEGAEEDVFNGNLDWLDKVKILVIEIHDKYVDGQDIRNKLKEKAFELADTKKTDCEVYINQNF